MGSAESNMVKAHYSNLFEMNNKIDPQSLSFVSYTCNEQGEKVDMLQDSRGRKYIRSLIYLGNDSKFIKSEAEKYFVLLKMKNQFLATPEAVEVYDKGGMCNSILS